MASKLSEEQKLAIQFNAVIRFIYSRSLLCFRAQGNDPIARVFLLHFIQIASSLYIVIR